MYQRYKPVMMKFYFPHGSLWQLQVMHKLARLHKSTMTVFLRYEVLWAKHKQFAKGAGQSASWDRRQMPKKMDQYTKGLKWKDRRPFFMMVSELIMRRPICSTVNPWHSCLLLSFNIDFESSPTDFTLAINPWHCLHLIHRMLEALQSPRCCKEATWSRQNEDTLEKPKGCLYHVKLRGSRSHAFVHYL